MSATTSEPLISICVPCYNHEKYIPYFLETLFSQSFTDWELIVTDDCSTDNSYQILQKFATDKRVRIYKNDRNRHLCYTLDHSLSQAKGKYICLMYTDDAFVKDKLANDFRFMEEHEEVGVLYTDLIDIGEDNEDLHHLRENLNEFRRYEILRRLFLFGNCLLIPGLVFRRSCLNEVGFFNPLLCLTQDYEYHIRLILNFIPAKSKESTVFYRIRENGQNLSAPTLANASQTANEFFLCVSSCIRQIKDLTQFSKIFPDFKKVPLLSSRDIPFYVALMLVESPTQPLRAAGLRILYDFTLKNIKYVEKEYGFTAKDFMDICRHTAIFGEFGERFTIDESKITRVWTKIIFKVWKSFTRKLRRRGVLNKV